MFLASVEESEVINIVRNCKNKKSTGYDGIDMTIIKQVIYHIIKPFTHICNNSFENGVFPSKMKIAKVVPIFKAGDKSSFNNSLLQTDFAFTTIFKNSRKIIQCQTLTGCIY